ncbi:MAG: hypothetical protein O7B25_17170, partial [Gammaproteobacteria bacterium]|nr:hypothetical protein [Gammaproteobacteria bacterium]
FLSTLRSCDRASVTKVVSRKMKQSLNAAYDKDATQAREECRMLAMFLPGDLKDASEVIDGNRGTIQWLTVKTDANGTMKSETTQDFVNEDGVWPFDN